MPKRADIRAQPEATDGRSERPATGRGQPRAACQDIEPGQARSHGADCALVRPRQHAAAAAPACPSRCRCPARRRRPSGCTARSPSAGRARRHRRVVGDVHVGEAALAAGPLPCLGEELVHLRRRTEPHRSLASRNRLALLEEPLLDLLEQRAGPRAANCASGTARPLLRRRGRDASRSPAPAARSRGPISTRSGTPCFTCCQTLSPPRMSRASIFTRIGSSPNGVGGELAPASLRQASETAACSSSVRWIGRITTCVRRDPRRQHEAVVVGVGHDHGADEPRRHAPRRGPAVLLLRRSGRRT